MKVKVLYLTIKEALINSSMNYQRTQKIKCDFSFASFSMAYQPLEMAAYPCAAETLVNSEFPE